MKTIFNITGDKARVNTLIERVKHYSGDRNVIDDVFPAAPFERDINIIAIDDDIADNIVEFCEERNFKCKMV